MNQQTVDPNAVEAELEQIRALGIDVDPDAIQAARENLAHNGAIGAVAFEVVDLTAAPLPSADVVTANLTGAQIVRSSAALMAAVRDGGTIILSGLQTHEREDVVRACASGTIIWELEEDGWVGLAVKKS